MHSLLPSVLSIGRQDQPSTDASSRSEWRHRDDDREALTTNYLLWFDADLDSVQGVKRNPEMSEGGRLAQCHEQPHKSSFRPRKYSHDRDAPCIKRQSVEAIRLDYHCEKQIKITHGPDI